jgi:putative transposase
MPNRPPRLDWVFQRYDPPLYFVTFNIHRRRKLLANPRVHNALIHFAVEGQLRGIGIGRYVIMPDHVHVFVRGRFGFSLRQWVRILKRVLSQAISAPPPHWQQGFFDHLIRHSESYAAKWEYVRENPVRAGLAQSADEWPWQGEVVRLEAERV